MNDVSIAKTRFSRSHSVRIEDPFVYEFVLGVYALLLLGCNQNFFLCNHANSHPGALTEASQALLAKAFYGVVHHPMSTSYSAHIRSNV